MVWSAVRIAYPREWTPRRGPAEILCWGILRSGLPRHPADYSVPQVQT